MTSELSDFADRLRRRFFSEYGVAPSPDSISDDPSSDPGDDVFNLFAQDLFALQFQHNAPYRQFCAARGVTPDTIEHWQNIPAIPTIAFKELELSCLPCDQRTTVFQSSGTTEQRPSRHFHNAESLAVYQHSLLPWFRTHIGRGGRWMILTPTAAAAPHSSLVHMFDVIRGDEGEDESVFAGRVTTDGAWTIDFEPAVQMLKAAAESSTRSVLLGTAFSFVHLLDHLVEKNLRFQLPPGSLVMETGGYKGRSRVLLQSELHAFITERLGIPAAGIIREYGMSELSSQAYDTGRQKAERLFHFPPWARAQIILPETGRPAIPGETGLLRIFDLANIFSVLAVQTEDLAIGRADGFELAGRAAMTEPRGCSLMTDSAFRIPHSALE